MNKENFVEEFNKKKKKVSVQGNGHLPIEEIKFNWLLSLDPHVI